MREDIRKQVVALAQLLSECRSRLQIATRQHREQSLRVVTVEIEPPNRVVRHFTGRDYELPVRCLRHEQLAGRLGQNQAGPRHGERGGRGVPKRVLERP